MWMLERSDCVKVSAPAPRRSRAARMKKPSVTRELSVEV